MKQFTVILLIVLLATSAQQAEKICIKNFRCYRYGSNFNYGNDCINDNIQKWFAEHPTVQILNFGYGDMLDLSGSGSYAWVLYKNNECF